MDELIIRMALPDDAGKIVEYMNKIGGESDNLSFGANGFRLKAEQERKFIENNVRSESPMFVGLLGSEIAAVASFSTTPRVRFRHRAEVAVSVQKKYWHQGIGRKMMEKLIEHAKELGFVNLLELYVYEFNENAVKLYEKLGFQKAGLHPKFVCIDDKYYGAYYMYLDI